MMVIVGLMKKEWAMMICPLIMDMNMKDYMGVSGNDRIRNNAGVA
jgi:hypothetical protein